MTTLTIDTKKLGKESNRSDNTWLQLANGSRFFNWDKLAGIKPNGYGDGFSQIDRNLTLAHHRHVYQGSELFATSMVGFSTAENRAYAFGLGAGISDGYTPLVVQFFVEPGDVIRFNGKDWKVVYTNNENIDLEPAE